jgi:hydroxypyruvate isomerase
VPCGEPPLVQRSCWIAITNNTTDELIRLIDAAWSEIAYVQCGDRPGRKEPGTGGIGYGGSFEHLHRAGYRGIVGMEHGNSRPGIEGERP